ncbi:MAG: cyclic nucleotide-binding domain-containing protein [Amphritea sp.]
MKSVTETEVFNKYPAEYFKDASTFGAISETTITWLFKHGRIIQLDADDTLFQIDEHGDNFFVILKGSFAYYKSHKGKYAFIRDYKIGEQIGFMSMVALHNRVGTAVANEESLVLEVSNNLFNKLHSFAPEDFALLMMNLAREMARTLRATDNLVVRRTFEAGGSGKRNSVPTQFEQHTIYNSHSREKLTCKKKHHHQR